MRTPWYGVVMVILGTVACGRSTPAPSSPSPVTAASAVEPTPAPGPCVIGFDDLRDNGLPFTTHAACGLVITAKIASWQASTTFGRPAPFIRFVVPGGTTAVGEVTVTAFGSFAFRSVDIYSSTTKIPYEMSGLANGTQTFIVQGIQGNTFGAFASIVNPRSDAPIDTLQIRLTNPAAPCCTNPVGLDNIRVVR